MPSPWYERVRKSGQLTVYNGAGAWSSHVTKAITAFNALPFRITMLPESDERKANVVVKLSDGTSTSFPWNGNEVKANFDATTTHGQTGSFLDSRDRVEKAVIFLPERLKNVSDEVKVLVVVHELIHSCGLVEKNDHDPIGGILYAKLQLFNGKLREPSTDKTLQGMPPIRVGGWTQCKIAELWQTAEVCKE